MDRIERYRDIVTRIIRDYAAFKPSNGESEAEAIIDRDADHYEVMLVGWDGHRRVHGCVVHMDIRGGKVWIQHDGTNRPVAAELIEAGVPKQDIVLGWHAPHERKYTEYAVG